MLSIKFKIHCLYLVGILGRISIYYHVHETFVTMKIQILENIIVV